MARFQSQRKLDFDVSGVIDFGTALRNFQDNKKLFFCALAKIEGNVLNQSMESLALSFDHGNWS